MADGSGGRKGRPKLPRKRSGNGSGVVDTGLPVQPFDWEAGVRNPDLRGNGCNQRILASLPGDEPSGAGGAGGEDNIGGDVVHGGGLCAGGDGNGGDGQRVEQNGVQSAGRFELTQLADVAAGYREPVEGAVAEAAEARLRDESEVLNDNATALERLTAKALCKLDEIIDIALPPQSSDHYGRVLSAQKDASVAIVNSALKADENRFRRRQTDVLEKLYSKMRAEKHLLAAVV